MKRVLIVCGGVLIVVAAVLFIWAPGALVVQCDVGGPLAGGNRCTFTNSGYLPARECVVVRVENYDYWTTSVPTCSGLVFARSTVQVPVPGFKRDPREFCSSHARCDISIQRQ